MELFILTQESTIINVEKIQCINVLGGIVENEKHEEFDAIEIAAIMDDNENTEIPLGIYITEEQASVAMNELTAWLGEKNEYNRVFKMPSLEDDTKSTESADEGLELDYGLQENRKSD